jgi:hypothetical protein
MNLHYANDDEPEAEDVELPPLPKAVQELCDAAEAHAVKGEYMSPEFARLIRAIKAVRTAPAGYSPPVSPIGAQGAEADELFKQPGWDHVFAAFVEGAREARVNPEADDHIFQRAADGYTKRVFAQVDPETDRRIQENDWPAAPAPEGTQDADACTLVLKPAGQFDLWRDDEGRFFHVIRVGAALSAAMSPPAAQK